MRPFYIVVLLSVLCFHVILGKTPVAIMVFPSIYSTIIYQCIYAYIQCSDYKLEFTLVQLQLVLLQKM